jgi:hypothetical protein
MDVLQEKFLMLPKEELGDIQFTLNCYAASAVKGVMKERFE